MKTLTVALVLISGVAQAQSWQNETGPYGSPPPAFAYGPITQDSYGYRPDSYIPALPPLPAVPDMSRSYVPEPQQWRDLPCTMPSCR